MQKTASILFPLWSTKRGEAMFINNDVSLRFASFWNLFSVRLDLMINDFAWQAIHQPTWLSMKNTFVGHSFMYTILLGHHPRHGCEQMRTP